MVITAKEQLFVARKMGSKGVHLVPGYGPATASKLSAKGFERARDLYQKFLEEDEPVFDEWLKEVCRLNRLLRDMVLQSFNHYKNEWGEDY